MPQLASTFHSERQEKQIFVRVGCYIIGCDYALLQLKLVGMPSVIDGSA